MIVLEFVCDPFFTVEANLLPKQVLRFAHDNISMWVTQKLEGTFMTGANNDPTSFRASKNKLSFVFFQHPSPEKELPRRVKDRINGS